MGTEIRYKRRGIDGSLPESDDGPSTALIQLEHVLCKCIHKISLAEPQCKTRFYIIGRSPKHSNKVDLAVISYTVRLSSLCPVLFFFFSLLPSQQVFSTP